ncbi:helix-turn-helix transcriptional regulator [Glaciimonas immobilis]|uniref:DNA-binding CsgD family transcriptional regulator n=1 Tax=Glaciimonas immobilis TaxID=728004 RepID=A0A840RSN2_9BURK|nr:helix-turn-helix transcriptional regulator [Glaciimonas immobilis]KAF3996847.1 helix-turn-helix transcriptional regulator [Glaciimonas immobilis]MBB5199601.1 DNA-binding CsgD family transcriptional regulator [Glaciimonas immobilis]
MARQVDPKLLEIFDKMPGCWGCKDQNSKFLYVNEAYARLIGLNNNIDIVGCSDFDLPCGASRCAGLFQRQDQEVISSAKSLRVLDIHPRSEGEWSAYIFTKMPMRDEEGRICGIIFHGENITSVRNLELEAFLTSVRGNQRGCDLLKQESYFIKQERGSIKLTCRESEVLFFLMRGNTAKMTSSILNISRRTVEQYVTYLKAKFAVVSKYELLDRAIELGYLSYIPQSLFSQQLSVILRDTTESIFPLMIGDYGPDQVP